MYEFFLHLVGDRFGEPGNKTVGLLPCLFPLPETVVSDSVTSLSTQFEVISFKEEPRANILNCISNKLAIRSSRSIAPSTVPGVLLAGVRPALLASTEDDFESAEGVVYTDKRGIDDGRCRRPFLNDYQYY